MCIMDRTSLSYPKLLVVLGKELFLEEGWIVLKQLLFVARRPPENQPDRHRNLNLPHRHPHLPSCPFGKGIVCTSRCTTM